MSDNINLFTQRLKQLLIDENFKIPDLTGVTPLLQKAKINADFSPLSSEKKFEEMVVCELVKYFNEFNQIHFSELESYIIVSEFSTAEIILAFKDFVLKTEKNEDIILKACVARTVQSMNKKEFSLEYLNNRFERLNSLDPWLLLELTINLSLQKGILLAKRLLQENYDASYLFTILPALLNQYNNTDIGDAFSNLYDYLSSDDQELANYYADNYGFKISKAEQRSPAPYRSVIAEEVVNIAQHYKSNRLITINTSVEKKAESISILASAFGTFNQSRKEEKPLYLTLTSPNLIRNNKAKRTNRTTNNNRRLQES